MIKQEFDIERALREVLSDGRDSPSIFDRFLQRFESYSSRPVSSLNDMRKRDNKLEKGKSWERFCKYYLITVCKYANVWLWNEIPAEIRVLLNLKSHQDNGIDIIAQFTEESGYVAIQCKYRKNIKQTITWASLSTFVGLCAITGPFEKQIVMTNCAGITRKVPRTEKDYVMAHSTFRKLSRSDLTSGECIALASPVADAPMSHEELRTLRLRRFEGLSTD